MDLFQHPSLIDKSDTLRMTSAVDGSAFLPVKNTRWVIYALKTISERRHSLVTSGKENTAKV